MYHLTLRPLHTLAYNPYKLRDRARTLEEVDGLVGNQVAGKILRRVYTAHNEGTAEICALEQFHVAGFGLGLFKLDNATHHCNSLQWVHPRLASLALN